ncbi:MAG: hypothetical protein JWP27_1725 [Flaviaesturariibacter sp.]|nr:hypothetical protein [Flaviaesturariibacter sp.]
MLLPQTLQYLRQLKENNNKAWFDANRVAYEAARIDFSNFIQLLIEDLERQDPTIAGTSARSAIFRINRDIRFSNDKTPYKSHFGASIKRGGRKSGFAGYYFHLEPGASFIGGGLWMPEAGPLKAVRQEIDYNWEEFRGVLTESSFKKIFRDLHQGEDVSLKTLPKGYERENPAIAYLRLKSFIAEVTVTDAELTKATLHKKTKAAFTALQPLLGFLNRALGGEGND